MANGRQLNGQPLELVKKALKLDPENPKALELAGSAAFHPVDLLALCELLEGLAPSGIT